MKKICVALLSAILVICICIPGCKSGNTEEGKDAESLTEEAESPSEPQEEAAGNSTAENTDDTEDIQMSTGFSTEYTVTDAKDGYFIVSKLDNTLFGLLDSYGNEILPLEYDSIIFPESIDAQAIIVKTEGKMGLFDYNGNEILPLEYESISNYGSNSELYLVQKDGAQCLIGLDGTVEMSLDGIYDAVLNNSFLVSGFDNYLSSYSARAVYNLDEKLLYECKYEKSQRSEYDHILSMDDVDGLIKLFSQSPAIYSSLMDDSGQIIFTTTDSNSTDWDINPLQDNNLFRITGESQKLYNLTTGTISEQEYNNIVRADEDTILASRRCML